MSFAFKSALLLLSFASAQACTTPSREFEYRASVRGLSGDTMQYRVRIQVDSTAAQVRYLILAPRNEIQVFGVGGTFNPDVVQSECRVFDAENFSCSNFNILLRATVARLVMAEGVLSESGVGGEERVYTKVEVSRQ